MRPAGARALLHRNAARDSAVQMRNALHFVFAGCDLTALPSGALWWPAERLLCVSDLHLGKSERAARRGGALLPPYEVVDTLTRLEEDLTATDPRAVVSLGDAFDDMDAAEALAPGFRDWIARLMVGRDWTWITGNHDPAPTGLGGHAVDGLSCGPLTFRHIAAPRRPRRGVGPLPSQGGDVRARARRQPPVLPARRRPADPAGLRHLHRRAAERRPSAGRPDGAGRPCDPGRAADGRDPDAALRPAGDRLNRTAKILQNSSLENCVKESFRLGRIRV